MIVSRFKTYAQEKEYNKYRLNEFQLIIKYRVKKYSNGDEYRGKLIDGKRNGFGSLVNVVNNHTFIGYFKDDLFDGEGFFQLSNNDIYIGNFSKGLFHGKGALYQINGNTYKGDFKSNVFDGVGSFSSVSGLQYKGEFCNGVKCGSGELHYPNGNSYKGEFESDSEHGYGVLNSKNGAIFKGIFKGGKVSGRGILTTSNKDKYTGIFDSNLFSLKFTGKFDVIYSNGDIYSGSIENGLKSGLGNLISNGSTYDGSFVAGVKQGHGTLTQKNGSIYVGDFVDDKFSGQGKLTIPNNSKINSDIINLSDVYIGGFENGLYNGIGEIMYSDGSSYNGSFLNGKKHGVGVLKSNGDVFEGNFVGDFKRGIGVMSFKNGDFYAGNYFDDMWDEAGNFISKNGDVYKAFFDSNRMLSFELNFNNGDVINMKDFDDNDFKYICKNGNYLIGLNNSSGADGVFVADLYNSKDILLKRITRTSEFKLPDIISNNPINVYGNIEKAIKEDLSVEIFYRNSSYELSNRVISDIKYTDKFSKRSKFETHISAFCHNRNEERNFKIDRIKFVRFI